jgi:hypothetical protein
VDAATLTTAAATAGSALDLGVLVSVVVAILAAFGAPWWVSPALRIGAALFLRRGPGVSVEPAPEPVSDGGTDEDRDRPASQPEVTAPIDLTRHSGDAG